MLELPTTLEDPFLAWSTGRLAGRVPCAPSLPTASPERRSGYWELDMGSEGQGWSQPIGAIPTIPPSLLRPETVTGVDSNEAPSPRGVPGALGNRWKEGKGGRKSLRPLTLRKNQPPPRQRL